jgi:hypothetical protein
MRPAGAGVRGAGPRPAGTTNAKQQSVRHVRHMCSEQTAKHALCDAAKLKFLVRVPSVVDSTGMSETLHKKIDSAHVKN